MKYVDNESLPENNGSCACRICATDMLIPKTFFLCLKGFLALLMLGVLSQLWITAAAGSSFESSPETSSEVKEDAPTGAQTVQSAADISPFPIHGVVEGFYGSHWTPDERLDVIRFMGEVGLQSYFYAPKDDPYHRSRWREPYAGEQLEIFQELLDVADKNDVIIYYAISPGLDMVYSSEDDYQALLDKMEAMTGLGITHVALFLDDVPETLNHEDDLAQFDNLGEAHVHVINRLYEDLKQRGTRLVVCPTTYTDAWGNRDYVYTLGEGVPEEVPLFWTGTDVAISHITAEEARNWGEKMQRKPLIWDNFPVNDYDSWRVFLGPLEGRDPDLAKTTTGIVANPMNQPYASMIPMATVAYYALDPYNYEPEPARDRALNELFPDDAIPHIRELVRLYREPGWDDNVFTPIYTPGKPFHVATIAEGLGRFQGAIESLISLGYEPFDADDDTNGNSPENNGSESEYDEETGTDSTDADDDRQTRRVRGLVSELIPFLEDTRNDFEAMVADPDYYVDRHGMLQYQVNRQTLTAREAPFDVDMSGDLTEWKYEGFYTIPVAGNTAGRAPETAVVHDDTHLYFGMRFYREGRLAPREPFFQGDHIMLIVDTDPDDTVTWIKPQDPVIVMRPEPDPDEDADGDENGIAEYGTDNDEETTSDVAAGASAQRLADEDIDWQEPGYKVRVMDLTPFTQRGISDINLYTLTGFFYHQVTNPIHSMTNTFAEKVSFGWQETDYGYSAVLAMPHDGKSEMRATVAGLMTSGTDDGRQSHRFLLSARPYLGNTYTFPLIQLTGLEK